MRRRRRRSQMPTHRGSNRREFLKSAGWGSVALTACMVGTGRAPVFAAALSKFPDWIPVSPKPPRRGGTLTRASAWDPPVLDPRLTQSIGLFQFAGLTSNRLIRYAFPEEASGTNDLTLKGDLAESWSSSPDHRVWTFKLRQGVKWHNLPPLKVRVVLQRNPDYFDKGRPYVDECVILSTPDMATRKAAFRTDQSDILQVASPSEVEVILKTNPAALAQEYKNVLAPFGLALAQDRPPFNDLRVRRAVSMAIDRPKQVETVYEGHGIPGWGVPYIYYQDRMPTMKDLGPWWQYRPEEAKKLLAEAGHAKGFETTLFYYEYFPQMTSQIQLVQQDLKKNLNIDVKITKLDYTTYYGRYVDSKWDGMSWGFQSGHAVGLDERTYMYLHSKSTKNFFRVNDPIIDELTTKLRQTPDRGEQRTIARKIVDREYDQVLRMWMPYDNGFLVFQPHVRNMAALALRRTDGYGASAIARLWLDK